MFSSIEKRPVCYVLGVMSRINPVDADYRDLWENQYMLRHAEIAALALEGGHYGVYYACGEQGLADFLSGMVVPASTEVQPGLTLREIPAGDYAAFECTMGTIGPTWQEIYGTWKAGIGLQGR